MPEISRFFGIIIAIYYDDHNPPRAMGIVIEWAMLRKNELLSDWNLAKEQKELVPIEPLI